jgi:hypothetical protein
MSPRADWKWSVHIIESSLTNSQQRPLPKNHILIINDIWPAMWATIYIIYRSCYRRKRTSVIVRLIRVYTWIRLLCRLGQLIHCAASHSKLSDTDFVFLYMTACLFWRALNFVLWMLWQWFILAWCTKVARYHKPLLWGFDPVSAQFWLTVLEKSTYCQCFHAWAHALNLAWLTHLLHIHNSIFTTSGVNLQVSQWCCQFLYGIILYFMQGVTFWILAIIANSTKRSHINLEPMMCIHNFRLDNIINCGRKIRGMSGPKQTVLRRYQEHQTTLLQYT